MTDLDFESLQDSFQESRGPDQVCKIKHPNEYLRCCEMTGFQDLCKMFDSYKVCKPMNALSAQKRISARERTLMPRKTPEINQN